jgi:Melibiase/Alpha galactosidase C-terminal beta sandwich domain
MRALSPALLCVVLAVAHANAAAGDPVTLTHEGWTVTADGGLLAIAHDRLGPLVQNARLNVRDERGLHSWTSWSAEPSGDGQLLLRTAEPSTTWQIDLGTNTLTISSTSTRAVLTGEAPAGSDRVVARLLDRRGVPVEWVGTDEVAHGYGGSETKNPSFLPVRNPDVMYFALGSVSGDTFHSLFDRASDVAIRFSDDTRMERDPRSPDRLDLTVPVPGSTLVRLLPDYYTKTLGIPFYVPFDDSEFPRPPTTWCSWTSYYAEVTEEDMVRNADWIAENLLPYGFEYVQLDDGYDRGEHGEHYWIERWDGKKFPHGPAWLAGYIKSRGLRPGLWLVPNAYAGAVEAHPDWYLRDKEGKIVLDYNTPALDSTHPEVLGFLRKLFTTLRDWGFEYYKFDGEHALPRYIPSVDRSRLHDPSVDPIVAYRNRLALIRETVGPRTFVEGCPAGTPLNGIGYFDSYFDGHDVYNSWPGMYALFSSINANAFLNHIVSYVMPGEGIEIGPPMSVEEAEKRRPPSFVQTARTREDPLVGFGTTLAEARTLVSYLALTGVAYPVSSVMPELPPERVALLKATLPPAPILPVDLFSRGTDMQWDRFKHVRPDDYIHNYPEVLDLKVSAVSGTYDVVGVTNWRSAAITRRLSFAGDLGLRGASGYVAFDFWGQKPLGVFTNAMDLEVEPHDTRVVLLHHLRGRPQLIGTSRHITGAHSVEALAWDAGSRTLRGSSRTVPGEEYALFVHVPEGMTVAGAHAAVEGGEGVPVRQEGKGPSARLAFPGQRARVDWTVEFQEVSR